MKPKKTIRADLRSRRAIFFEIGFIVALAAAIVTFSIGQSEKTLKNYTEPQISDGFVLPPISTTQPEPPKMKPQMPKLVIGGINIVKNDSKIIDPGWIFNPEDYEGPGIPIPEPEEPEDDGTPIWIAEEMPTFQGGDLNNFRRWVLSQIEYPRAAVENWIQGRVTVKFVVEKDGSLSNIEVEVSPDRSLADETIRVLGISPKWTPGKQRGKPVRVYYVLPVDYRLSN